MIKNGLKKKNWRWCQVRFFFLLYLEQNMTWNKIHSFKMNENLKKKTTTHNSSVVAFEITTQAS